MAALYGKASGGKAGGRYRIAAKLLRETMGRKRIYDDDVRALTRALFERGFVLVDMDAFFVVISANTFVNYRRASRDCLAAEPE